MLKQEGEPRVETAQPVATQSVAPRETPVRRRSPHFNSAMVGLVLVAVGVMSLVGILWPSQVLGLLVLPILGAIFLAWAYLQRASALLIPGCILMGLGLGTFIQQTWLTSLTGEASGGIVVLGLALGFLAIMPLVQLMDRHFHWWPAIPGGILLAVSLGLLAGPNGLPYLYALNYLWPIALIVVGGYLLWMVYWRRGDRRGDHEHPGRLT
jgi:hypothetical protein